MGCCLDCVEGLALKVLVWLVSVLKIAMAVAIIVIVYEHLWKVDVQITYDDPTQPVSVETVCLLGTKDGQALCNYAYAVCGLSILASMVISILMCATCNLCGLSFVVETVFSLLGTLWWLAASLIFTKYTKDADDQDYDAQKWRHAVVVLSWVAFGAFSFLLLVGLCQMGKCICGGCCGRSKNDEMAGASKA